MITRIAARSLYRFCAIETTHSSLLTTTEEQKADEVPIHLRPYNKLKYEMPTKKIKRNSGT